LEKMGVSPALQPDFNDDFEKFFLLFPIKELAADLFTVFEHGRIRLIMNRRYQGMARQIFPLLRKEAEREHQDTSPEVSALYRRIALGELSGISENIRHQINRIAESFEQKIEQNNSVETCAEMLSETYNQICDPKSAI